MKTTIFNHKSIIILFTIAVASITIYATAAFITIKGSGNVIKEIRNISNFHSIIVSNAFDVYLTQGERFKVEVETDDNIMQYVATEVTENGSLKINYKDSKLQIKNSTKSNVYVTMPQLKSIKSSGATSVIAKEMFNVEELKMECSGASDINMLINANALTLDLSGASDIKLKGNATQMNAQISGASDFICPDLDIQNANLQVSGASDVKVKVINTLEAEVSGASDFAYSNVVKNKEIKGSGASDIKSY